MSSPKTHRARHGGSLARLEWRNSAGCAVRRVRSRRVKMPGARTEAQRGRVLAPAPSFLFIRTRGERTFRACGRRAVSITDTMRASSKRKNGPHGACSRHRNLGCKLPIAFVAHRTLCLKEPDAGVRTSLFQIKRRACGGRPMTAAAARRRVFVRGEGGTRRCIVIDTCSFRDSSPKMCSRHGPSCVLGVLTKHCFYPHGGCSVG